MTKNFKSFCKSLSLANILFKILVLFFIGIFSRFLINYLFDFTLLIELLSFLSISLCISQFSFLDSVESKKFFEDNINLFKRPRDRVLSNNEINEDYGLRNKIRRKSHWVFFNQFGSEFKDYKDFKNYWNPDKKYIYFLKDEYNDKKHKIKVFKRTLSYFLHGRKGS